MRTSGSAAPGGLVDTPVGTGVSHHHLGAGEAVGGLALLSTEGPTDVVVTRVVIRPGAETGWHYHHGQVIAVVVQGTLTRVLDDGSVQITPAGQTVLEQPGRERIHLGCNLGAEPVVIVMTYLLPRGAPLAVQVPAPPPAPVPATPTG